MGAVLVVAPFNAAQSMGLQSSQLKGRVESVPRLTGIHTWHLGYVSKPQGPAQMFGQYVQTENFKLGTPSFGPSKRRKCKRTIFRLPLLSIQTSHQNKLRAWWLGPRGISASHPRDLREAEAGGGGIQREHTFGTQPGSNVESRNILSV